MNRNMLEEELQCASQLCNLFVQSTPFWNDDISFFFVSRSNEPSIYLTINIFSVIFTNAYKM